MRCKFCGSQSVHAGTQHKNFSGGKAVVGTIVFGAVGAVAGLAGKEQKGYCCAACGAFMESPMDFATEMAVNNAVREAESGGSRSTYDYYKKQYCNIQANIPAPSEASAAKTVYVPIVAKQNAPVTEDKASAVVKHSYRNLAWNPGCPVFVDTVTILTENGEDHLQLIARNLGQAAIRSVYFTAKVLECVSKVKNCRNG